MASGAGKATQPAGQGSAVNGTAAEFPSIEQETELYDYQMHSKMCKKIAQLTKVSLWHRCQWRLRSARRRGRAVTVCPRLMGYDGSQLIVCCQRRFLSYTTKCAQYKRVMAYNGETGSLGACKKLISLEANNGKLRCCAEGNMPAIWNGAGNLDRLFS